MQIVYRRNIHLRKTNDSGLTTFKCISKIEKIKMFLFVQSKLS